MVTTTPSTEANVKAAPARKAKASIATAAPSNSAAAGKTAEPRKAAVAKKSASSLEAKATKPTNAVKVSKTTAKPKAPKAVKVIQSTKADKAAKPAKAPKLEKPARKDKLVRDSFTMPEADFKLIAAVKQRALQFQHTAKKSEILRAGLVALQGLGEPQLRSLLENLPVVKTGRPKKAS